MDKKNEPLSSQECQFVIQNALQAEIARYADGAGEIFGIYNFLDSVSKRKVNPAYEFQNLQQQSGFTAEAMHVARTNAQNVIAGNTERYARTDDVGMKNHPQSDVTRINQRNSYAILDREGQLVGAGQMKVHHRIEKYDYLARNLEIFTKYKGVEILVPSDQFDAVRDRWSAQINGLEKQCNALQARGELELAQLKSDELERIKNARARLRKANVSTLEAMEARLHPDRVVLKDVAAIAHQSGLDAAQSSLIYGGVINSAIEAGQVLFTDKELDDAMVDTIRTTLVGAGTSYGVNYVTTTASGLMQASSKEIIRSIGQSNIPATVVQSGVILARNSYLVLSGKMSSEEFSRAVTSEGCALGLSMIGSSLGGTLGGLAAGGLGISMTGACVVVGALAGGIVATMLSGAMYNALQENIRSLDESNSHRQAMQAHCEMMLEKHRLYRERVDLVFGQFFEEKEAALKEAFGDISEALLAGSSISPGLSKIANALGMELLFQSDDDFRSFLRSKTPLRLGR